MAATDYEITFGCLNPYLAKKKKTKSKTMSQDRRPITDNEIISLFEFYLRKWYSENEEDTLVITDENGKKLFQATLLDENNE